MNKRVFYLFPVWILVCFSQLTSANQLADREIDFNAIAQQALFANAAYQSENDIRQLGLAQGYTLTLYRNVTDIQLSFYLLTNDKSKTQIVAVRGTSNIENAMIDINLKLVIDNSLNIHLHHGFAYAARQVYRDLKPLIKKDYSINITGHSLGGAVSVILSALLDDDELQVSQVVTFGQPKVTNLAGVDKFQHLDIIRVVTPKDLVPLVPLLDPLDINNIDIFWHTGTEVILLEGNQYAVLEGVESMLRATRFTQQALTDENLRHHQMTLYLQSLQPKLDSAEQVSYETSLNLFNLFGNE